MKYVGETQKAKTKMDNSEMSIRDVWDMVKMTYLQWEF